MVEGTKLILNKIIFVLTLILITGCANQLPPGGGAVDSVPPEIIYTYPENGTINFSENLIEFEFSEYVDKRSFKDAVFISPAIDEQLEISWSGTSVEIVFPSGLKADQTYVVTIGTDVVDVNNKNRMANSYSFSFSTGSKIDKRSIEGKVYGYVIEGTMIFAYKMFNDDTTKYLSNKPDYISQIGKNGNYKLSGLSESKYRVFAVKDELRDLLYQAEQDMIGIPFTDISLTGIDSSYTGLNYFLFNVDTLKPRILNSVMTDKNHILVTLSEECDSSIYYANNFSIIDSTSKTVLPVDFIYKSKSKKEEIILSQKNELNTENIYYLNAKKLSDINGNIFENEFSSLVVSSKHDTTKLTIIKNNLNQKYQLDFKNPELLIYFDDALANKEVADAIQFEDTSKNKVPFVLTFVDDATLKLKPLKDLKPEKYYQVKINLAKFSDAAGNKTDTVVTIKFSTINGVEFTGVSGKIKTTKENVVIILQDASDQNRFYTAVTDNTYTYSFDRINAGSYTLWYYVDDNNNKTFDKGYPHPFKFSEEFGFAKDTLKLRPRWSVTDFDFDIK